MKSKDRSHSRNGRHYCVDGTPSRRPRTVPRDIESEVIHPMLTDSNDFNCTDHDDRFTHQGRQLGEATDLEFQGFRMSSGNRNSNLRHEDNIDLSSGLEYLQSAFPRLGIRANGLGFSSDSDNDSSTLASGSSYYSCPDEHIEDEDGDGDEHALLLQTRHSVGDLEESNLITLALPQRKLSRHLFNPTKYSSYPLDHTLTVQNSSQTYSDTPFRVLEKPKGDSELISPPTDISASSGSRPHATPYSEIDGFSLGVVDSSLRFTCYPSSDGSQSISVKISDRSLRNDHVSNSETVLPPIQKSDELAMTAGSLITRRYSDPDVFFHPNKDMHKRLLSSTFSSFTTNSCRHSPFVLKKGNRHTHRNYKRHEERPVLHNGNVLFTKLDGEDNLNTESLILKSVSFPQASPCKLPTLVQNHPSLLVDNSSIKNQELEYVSDYLYQSLSANDIRTVSPSLQFTTASESQHCQNTFPKTDEQFSEHETLPSSRQPKTSDSPVITTSTQEISKPSIEQLSLVRFFLEELLGIRSLRAWPEGESPVLATQMASKDSSGRVNTSKVSMFDSIPKNQIRSLVQLPLSIEKMLSLGLCICFQSFLYELTFMPIQAIVATFKLIHICFYRISKQLEKRSWVSRFNIVTLHKPTSTALFRFIKFISNNFYQFFSRIHLLGQKCLPFHDVSSLLSDFLTSVKVRQKFWVSVQAFWRKNWIDDSAHQKTTLEEMSASLAEVLTSGKESNTPPLLKDQPVAATPQQMPTESRRPKFAVLATTFKMINCASSPYTKQRNRAATDTALLLRSNTTVTDQDEEKLDMNESHIDMTTAYVQGKETTSLKEVRNNIQLGELVRNTQPLVEKPKYCFCEKESHRIEKAQSYAFYNSSSPLLSRTQACDLTRTLILLMGVWLFNSFVDISEVYHFIRAQSLMKLYVIFNMLEIFERLWRSLGRDALDSLMRQVVSFSVVERPTDLSQLKTTNAFSLCPTPNTTTRRFTCPQPTFIEESSVSRLATEQRQTFEKPAPISINEMHVGAPTGISGEGSINAWVDIESVKTSPHCQFRELTELQQPRMLSHSKSRRRRSAISPSIRNSSVSHTGSGLQQISIEALNREMTSNATVENLKNDASPEISRKVELSCLSITNSKEALEGTIKGRNTVQVSQNTPGISAVTPTVRDDLTVDCRFPLSHLSLIATPAGDSANYGPSPTNSWSSVFKPHIQYNSSIITGTPIFPSLITRSGINQKTSTVTIPMLGIPLIPKAASSVLPHFYIPDEDICNVRLEHQLPAFSSGSSPRNIDRRHSIVPDSRRFVLAAVAPLCHREHVLPHHSLLSTAVSSNLFLNEIQSTSEPPGRVNCQSSQVTASLKTESKKSSDFSRLLLYIILVLVYVVVHSFFHLIRVLLLNIAINSSDSVMFLIVTTNNFAEIKSTVFKKFTRSSLFTIAASDAVERFYLFCDALLVFLRLSVSARTSIVSYFSVSWWLISMVSLELLVDWFKHAFLLKLNFIESNVFDEYRQTLLADILVCRMKHSKSDNNDEIEKTLKTWSTPCRGFYSFSHICARRIGFIGLPLTAQLLCCMPKFPWFSSPVLVTLTVTLLWTNILILTVIVTLFLVAFTVSRRSKLTRLNKDLDQLSAL